MTSPECTASTLAMRPSKPSSPVGFVSNSTSRRMRSASSYWRGILTVWEEAAAHGDPARGTTDASHAVGAHAKGAHRHGDALPERRRSESNRRCQICSLEPYHLATAPCLRLRDGAC